MNKATTAQSQIISVLEKVPIFQGLTPQQSKKILGVCTKKAIPKKQILCRTGDESKEMYILLAGLLNITLNDGKELSRINPIGIVGEMGLFTGERRSANVTAAQDSVIFILSLQNLLSLFRADSEIAIRILMNVIKDMSHKLRKNNDIIEALEKLCPPAEAAMVIKKTLRETEEYRQVKAKSK